MAMSVDSADKGWVHVTYQMKVHFKGYTLVTGFTA